MATTQRTSRDGVLKPGGVLDRILDAKTKRLELAKRRLPIDEITEAAAKIASPGERESLSAAVSGAGRVNIIAEIKHRSPSKGIIREDFEPVPIAEAYKDAGAAALSVLTEEDFFGGSLNDLRAVRESVALPLLRKDFIVDEYQLYESVIARADAVLLIVAVLDDDLLARLLGLATKLGLEALVEVHSADEMHRAAHAGASIIGINNRDLTTFNVDLQTSIRLASLAPESAKLISESGINTAADIRRLKLAGFNAFLVGEHLMRARDPGAALRELIEEAET